MPEATCSRVERIAAAIRTIPNFPKPGICFQDVTTILLDPVAFQNCIDIFVEHYKGQDIDVVAGASIGRRVAFMVIYLGLMRCMHYDNNTHVFGGCRFIWVMCKGKCMCSVKLREGATKSTVLLVRGAGFEARGLIFGAPLALALKVPFVPLRKPGKLPGAVYCMRPLAA